MDIAAYFFIILMIKDFFDKVKESESFFRRH